jgi:hypothetical protein
MSVFAFGDLLHSVLGINLLKNDEKSKTWTQKRVFRALRNFENCNNFVLIEIRMKFDTGKCLGSITFRKKCTSGVTLLPTAVLSALINALVFSQIRYCISVYGNGKKR